MGNYTIFLNVRKSQERQASKKFYNKCSDNSRSQIVFRTDIFRKLSLGAPEILDQLNPNARYCARQTGIVEICYGCF